MPVRRRAQGSLCPVRGVTEGQGRRMGGRGGRRRAGQGRAGAGVRVEGSPCPGAVEGPVS